MIMILIRFPSTESKRLALACLADRFAFNSWATGEMLVPEDALPFLGVQGIAFAVEGPATSPVTKPLAATFFAGVGSALEILPPSSRIEATQTDAEAVAQDWATVAADLWLAIGSQSNESTDLAALESVAIKERGRAAAE
jgi:hypothetical protein